MYKDVMKISIATVLFAFVTYGGSAFALKCSDLKGAAAASGSMVIAAEAAETEAETGAEAEADGGEFSLPDEVTVTPGECITESDKLICAVVLDPATATVCRHRPDCRWVCR